MVFPHTSVSHMSASFLSSFFPAISKISEDQVAEIENEKERMKKRRGKKRKEEGEKSLKRISSECKQWVFSVLIGKVPPGCHLSSHGRAQGPLPFFLCLQPVRLKAPYGNGSCCSDSRFGPRPLFSKPHWRPGKNFFLQVPAMVPTYKANTRC